MYECIRHNVEYVLAGSIRDDGPLPDTIMDLRVAQDRYAEALQDVRLVLALSTMLHGIGVGNMLPSWVKMVCVDINPAVVTKLADRGSSQTIGIVTDVGLFLHRLAQTASFLAHSSLQVTMPRSATRSTKLASGMSFVAFVNSVRFVIDSSCYCAGFCATNLIVFRTSVCVGSSVGPAGKLLLDSTNARMSAFC